MLLLRELSLATESSMDIKHRLFVNILMERSVLSSTRLLDVPVNSGEG